MSAVSNYNIPVNRYRMEASQPRDQCFAGCGYPYPLYYVRHREHAHSSGATRFPRTQCVLFSSSHPRIVHVRIASQDPCVLEASKSLRVETFCSSVPWRLRSPSIMPRSHRKKLDAVLCVKKWQKKSHLASNSEDQ